VGALLHAEEAEAGPRRPRGIEAHPVISDGDLQGIFSALYEDRRLTRLGMSADVRERLLDDSEDRDREVGRERALEPLFRNGDLDPRTVA
jgi:hypothetical protein